MFRTIIRKLSYVQGQYREKTREYFYFIDHQGMVSARVSKAHITCTITLQQDFYLDRIWIWKTSAAAQCLNNYN